MIPTHVHSLQTGQGQTDTDSACDSKIQAVRLLEAKTVESWTRGLRAKRGVCRGGAGTNNLGTALFGASTHDDRVSACWPRSAFILERLSVQYPRGNGYNPSRENVEVWLWLRAVLYHDSMAVAIMAGLGFRWHSHDNKLKGKGKGIARTIVRNRNHQAQACGSMTIGICHHTQRVPWLVPGRDKAMQPSSLVLAERSSGSRRPLAAGPGPVIRAAAGNASRIDFFCMAPGRTNRMLLVWWWWCLGGLQQDQLSFCLCLQLLLLVRLSLL